MRLLTLLSFLAFCGCCYIPLFECGPMIKEHQIEPESLYIIPSKDIMLKFEAWQYSSRKDEKPYRLYLYYKIQSKVHSDIVLINKSKFHFGSGDNTKTYEYELSNIEVGKGMFYISFIDCCNVYPLYLTLDSIPIVVNRDTTYTNATLKIL